MNQEATTNTESATTQGDEHSSGGNLLGPILCWAVVFADIGTSVYYTPGILYSTVGKLAGFFIFLTMTVFVLLTLKYAEVSHRYPQGGGVVTVGARAIHPWVGALGGMFILVDYFLTAAISSLSGIYYLSVVVPSIGPYVLWITIAALIALGVLNWVGVSESAKVSFVGAVLAFASDIAILVIVFTNMSIGQVLALFPTMFSGRSLTITALLVGFGGSFLAFSGLESISQLSPVMKVPRKKTAGFALLFVVLTIGITSPLLTMLSTLLQPKAAANSVESAQIISLLAGHFHAYTLQTLAAISASALLVFASNTAIIGAYHVFLALSRMDFFPAFVLKRNKLRGTPHYAILLVTAIPVAVLLLVNGAINLLGDMYAFGLLGAFSLTCLGLDIVRYRERQAARRLRHPGKIVRKQTDNGNGTNDHREPALNMTLAAYEQLDANGHDTPAISSLSEELRLTSSPGKVFKRLWHTLDFWLGMLTTLLVIIAWSTNLVAKPLATAFGGGVAGTGMLIAYINYRAHKKAGRTPVMLTGIEGHLPGSVLAVLTAQNGQNDAVIRAAINHSEGRPIVFLYVGAPKKKTAYTPSMFEVVDPYLDDLQAKTYFGKAEDLARKAKIPRRFVYRAQEPDVVARIWQVVHPRDTVIAASNASDCEDINPDRIRYELTSSGKVAHLIKHWQ